MTDQAAAARLDRARTNPAQSSTPCSTGSRRRLRRIAVLVVTVAAVAGASFALPLDAIPRLTASLGPAAPAAAVGVGAVLLAALVPRTAISLACGALFGAMAGAACALAAALLAAVATYAAGRWAGRGGGRLGGGRLASRLAERLGRLDSWLVRRGLLAVVVVRMLPLAPYGLIGYAYGTSSVRRRHYLIGTAIGATPSCFSYAAIGAATVSPGSTNWITFLPAALGMVISVAAALHWRRCATRT